MHKLAERSVMPVILQPFTQGWILQFRDQRQTLKKGPRNTATANDRFDCKTKRKTFKGWAPRHLYKRGRPRRPPHSPPLNIQTSIHHCINHMDNDADKETDLLPYSKASGKLTYRYKAVVPKLFPHAAHNHLKILIAPNRMI